jgi:hypothetical protein
LYQKWPERQFALHKLTRQKRVVVQAVKAGPTAVDCEGKNLNGVNHFDNKNGSSQSQNLALCMPNWP